MEKETLIRESLPAGVRISFEWRLLAAICVVMQALVSFTIFGLADRIHPVYGIIFGFRPLPRITMLTITHGHWVKWMVGLALFGMGIWILRSKKTIPFFYAAIALIISNLLLAVLVVGILVPFLAALPLDPAP